MKTLRLNFEDKVFKVIQNAKEVAKINGECDSWQDYIVKLIKLQGGRAIK